MVPTGYNQGPLALLVFIIRWMLFSSQRARLTYIPDDLQIHTCCGWEDTHTTRLWHGDREPSWRPEQMPLLVKPWERAMMEPRTTIHVSTPFLFNPGGANLHVFLIGWP